jgi:hypothetical protein
MKLLKGLVFSVVALTSFAVQAQQVSYSFSGSLMYDAPPELQAYYSAGDAMGGIITLNATPIIEKNSVDGNDFSSYLLDFSASINVGKNVIDVKNGSFSSIAFNGTVSNDFSASSSEFLTTISQSLDTGSPIDSLVLWFDGEPYGTTPVGALDRFSTATLGITYKSATGPLYVFWSIDSIQRLPSVSAVPEPETYALMLAGVCFTGFMVRRNRQA